MGKTGIPWGPWDSHGNGSKISHGMGMGWEWESSAWEWELRRGSWKKRPTWWAKEVGPQTHGHNSVNSEAILKNVLEDSLVNL